MKQKTRISIHAPRTGSDCIDTNTFSPRPHFNPRSPHGERQNQAAGLRLGRKFQSTLPARGATSWACNPMYHEHISIHAPRTGSDMWMTSTI